MSDHTGTPEPEGTDPETPEVKPIDEMTEAELRAHYDALSDQIAEIDAQPATPALAQRKNQLRLERNATVEAVRSITATGSDVEDLSLDADAADDTDTTPADETAGDATPSEELSVADTPDTPEASDPSGDEVVAAAEDIVAESAHEGLAVVASADRPTAPAVTRERPVVAFVAGAGQRAFAPGVELNEEAMARAWDSRRNIAPSADGGPERAVIASLPGFDETPGLVDRAEMLSRDNTTLQNDRLIEASVDAWRAKRNGQPLTAVAASICEPLDIIREIPMCGEVDTPFTDLFPQRAVGRLGFQFTRAGTAASTNGAINLWTQEDQDGIDEADPSTWKPCVPITCATPDEVTAEELVTCVSVDSSTEMSSPERVRDFMHKLRVQRARRREQIQLDRFDATASGFTFDARNGYGTIPSLVEAIETMMPVLAYPERLDETDWDIVFEPGLVQKITIDRHSVCNPVEVAAARAETMAWLRSYLGRNVVELRDFKEASDFQDIPAIGQSDPMETIPETNRIRFVPAGAYIYGSTGEEATGWQTDPQLVRQNRKQAFTAEWFMLAKHGCHPAAYIDLTSVPDGGRGGCVTPWGSSDYTS